MSAPVSEPEAIRFSNTKILLIVPSNFSYGSAMQAELQRLGVEVILWSDRHDESFWSKAFLRIAPWLVERRAVAQFASRAEKDKASGFDFVLCVQGEAVFPATIAALRASSPKARFVFYIWDAFENKPFLRRHLKLFDQCFTFDPKDADTYKIGFRPLFFSFGHGQSPDAAEPKKFAVSMVGTLHGDRSRIAAKFLRANAWVADKTYLYMFAPSSVHRLKDLVLNGWARRGLPIRVSRQSIPREVAADITRASTAILDIEHRQQRGLTMRTLETLGAGRKLLTTNQNVRQYRFFDPARIQLLERDQPQFDESFLRAPLEPVPAEFLNQYSMKAWLTDLLFSESNSSTSLTKFLDQGRL